MSASLPTADPCCIPACDDVLVQNIPGPAGEDGADGAAGTNGTSAITTLTVAFTMPAEAASAAATMVSTAGLVIGENVFVQGLGTLQVTAIGSAITATLKNIEDTALMYYTSNAAPGTIAAIGSRVGPTGLQGPAGLLGGAAAGGQLKGTYPNPTLLIPNSLGALAVGNGTDAVSLSAGTAGYIPVNDAVAFPATGLGHKKILPVTGDAVLADNRVPRLDGATGLPIPMQSSKVEINDAGAIVSVGSNTGALGNARGTNATDLQVERAAATQVASGARSFIGGGQNNSALGTECVVTGGEDNIAGAVGQNHSVVAGGSGNAATGQESFVGGGQDNIASNTQSSVVGGDTNLCDAAEGFIGGGRLNLGHGPDGAIVAGVANEIQAGSDSGFIGAGGGNNINGDFSVIAGGNTNAITNDYAAIPGGRQALADKWGQRAFAAGQFAAAGDCQQTDLLWRITTTGIVGATEMFLDGVSLRATIASGRSVMFDIMICARSSAGLNAAWTVKGIINNLSGTTSIATAVVNALIADNSGATFGTLANVPVVAANDAADALVITVANPAATNVRWLAHGRLVEIGY